MKKYYYKTGELSRSNECLELCINKNKKHKYYELKFRNVYIGSIHCADCVNFIESGDSWIKCKDIENSVLKLQRKNKLEKLKELI